MPEATMTGAELGTLAVSMVANIQNFQMNMQKAMGLLKQFHTEAAKAGVKVSTTFQNMGKGTGTASKKMTTDLASANAKIAELQKQIGKLSATVKNAGTKIRSESAKTGREIGRRGNQNLGALLSFQEGVKKFVALNMRWFLVWRSFWAIWGQILRVGTDLKDLFDETAYALRTATNEAGSWVEEMIKGVEIQKMAIVFSMKHAVAMKDVIQTIYYLTTAGISYTNALKFANTAMLTSIALREKAVDTTRLLTGLYNIFGKTIKGVDSDLEAFNKIAAILTATFRKQDIEIHDYIKALPYAAQASKLMGIEIEVLVAAMGVLGTHFIRGSKAGTGFQRMLAFMIKNAERFAEITGVAFDPKDEIALVAVLRNMSRVIRESKEETEGFGVASELAGKIFQATGLRSAKVNLTLADSYGMLADQIELNYAAGGDLVKVMAQMVERTPTKQLQLLGQVFRGLLSYLVIGIARSANLAEALYKINTALEKMSPLFEELGKALGALVGSLRNLLALLAAVFVYFKWVPIVEAFTLQIWGLGYAFKALGASLLTVKLGIFGKAVASVTLFSKALAGTIVGLVAKFGLFAATLALTYIGIKNVIGATQSLRKSTKETMEEAAKWAVKDITAQKSRYEKTLEYIDGTAIAYGRLTAFQRKHAKIQLELLDKEFKIRIAKAEESGKNVSHLETMYAAERLQIVKNMYKAITGKEASSKDLQAMAAGAGIQKLLDMEQEGADARLEIHKWMDRELAQLELDRLSFTLWQLEKEFDEKREKLTEGSLDELRLRELYNKKVEKILNDYRILAVEQERKTVDEMRGVRLEGFDKELEAIEKRRKKITDTFAKTGLQQMKFEIESQKFRAQKLAEEDEDLRDHYTSMAETAENISRVLGEHLAKVPEIGATKAFTEAVRYLQKEGYTQLQESSKQSLDLMLENERAGWDKIVALIKENLEDIQDLTKANNEWMEKATIKSENVKLETVRKSYNKQIEDTDKKLKYLRSIVSIEGEKVRDKIEELEKQKTELTEIWGTRRAAIIKRLEKEWTTDTEKILRKRYGEYETEWEKEIVGFTNHYQKLQEEAEKTFKARVKDFKEGSVEIEMAETDLYNVLKKLKRNEAEDRKKLFKDNLAAYHLWNATIEEESLKTAENLSEFFGAAFGLIKETWLASVAKMREDAGTFSARLKGLWEGINNDIKTLTSDYLRTIIDGNKYTANVLDEIWERFYDSLKQRLADWLASEVWQEFLSAFGKKGEVKVEAKIDYAKAAIELSAQLADVFSKQKLSPYTAAEKMAKAIAEASEREMSINLKQPLTPAQKTIISPPVVVPSPQVSTSIINVLDPSLVPAGMLQNRSIILNVLDQNIIEKGSTYQIIKSL